MAQEDCDGATARRQCRKSGNCDRTEKEKRNSSYSILALVRYRGGEDILIDATECRVHGVASVAVVGPNDMG